MPEGMPDRKRAPECRKPVMGIMQKEKLRCSETARRSRNPVSSTSSERHALYRQAFQPTEQFGQELTGALDDCNNRKIKEKPKDLPPAIHRQQALRLLERCLL